MCSATSAGTDGSTMRLWMASCMWGSALAATALLTKGRSSDVERPVKHNLSGRRCGQRDALVPQVRRDAAEEERPARAEDEARIHVRRRRDDALVEEMADLVCHRFEYVARDLVDRPRA